VPVLANMSKCPSAFLQEEIRFVVPHDSGGDIAALAKDLADIEPAGQRWQQVVECVELAELVISVP